MIDERRVGDGQIAVLHAEAPGGRTGVATKAKLEQQVVFQAPVVSFEKLSASGGHELFPLMCSRKCKRWWGRLAPA